MLTPSHPAPCSGQAPREPPPPIPPAKENNEEHGEGADDLDDEDGADELANKGEDEDEDEDEDDGMRYEQVLVKAFEQDLKHEVVHAIDGSVKHFTRHNFKIPVERNVKDPLVLPTLQITDGKLLENVHVLTVDENAMNAAALHLAKKGGVSTPVPSITFDEKKSKSSGKPTAKCWKIRCGHRKYAINPSKREFAMALSMALCVPPRFNGARIVKNHCTITAAFVCTQWSRPHRVQSVGSRHVQGPLRD